VNNSGHVNGGSLSDLRVLDLTRVWAGPLATRILGDFGAQIIKISDPRTPNVPSNGINNKLNRNKLSLGLRLDKDEGKRVFKDLVAVSDVVIENFRPRVMRNLRLAYDELTSINPNIVMCSMPGFGMEGPYSEYPAYGTTAEAVAGIPSLIGYDPSVPMPTGIAYGDPISGLHAVGAVLASLRKRSATGSGQFIDIALAAGGAITTGEFLVASSTGSYEPDIRGNKHPDQAPHGAYRAAGDDRWIAISVTNNQEWLALCSVVDDDRLRDPRFSELEERKRDEGFIDSVISEWVENREVDELMNLLQDAGVPAGRVANSRQLLSDPHLTERDFFVELDEYEHGPKQYEGQSIPGNYTDKSSWEPSRLMGQDSRHILADILGYSDEQCHALASEDTVAFNHELPTPTQSD
jgi:crotonobetainyl-CoA:carnitine CoA-transferase CaiB-like acyl-CoA transferase